MRISIGKAYLVAALCVCAAFVAAILGFARLEENRYIGMQLSSARKMAEAEAYLKEKMLALGIEPEAEDINETLLFGPEFTELTSTPGAVEAKRTSLDPNFAAAMVRYYRKAGLKKGDTLAIGASGSFPGLAIAAVIAATEYGLRTEAIVSLGASMHGATRVEFNIFDILLSVKDAGYADFDLLAISRGGANDEGGSVMEGLIFEGTPQLAYDICRKVADETGAEFLVYDSLLDNMNRRIELFGDVDIFVNFGGALINQGVGMEGHSFPQGLILDRQPLPDVKVKGLCYEYSARGIPVLNLLNVKQLAADNGIPFDPVPLSKPEDCVVQSETRYSLALIILGIVSTTFILAVGVVLSRKKK